jgi:hypothetical protein
MKDPAACVAQLDAHGLFIELDGWVARPATRSTACEGQLILAAHVSHSGLFGVGPRPVVDTFDFDEIWACCGSPAPSRHSQEALDEYSLALGILLGPIAGGESPPLIPPDATGPFNPLKIVGSFLARKRMARLIPTGPGSAARLLEDGSAWRIALATQSNKDALLRVSAQAPSRSTPNTRL